MSNENKTGFSGEMSSKEIIEQNSKYLESKKPSFNKLTPAELERLACLSEECGEVIQAIGKILRHGYADYSLNDPTHTDNRKNLEKELGDLRYWMVTMCVEGDVSKEVIHQNADLKAIRVQQWLHHQI